ncbi:MAG TPA: thymidine phosphorylase, partial [Planctomycetota bacterium]|nr:thymidine phosphorylase [Planctomycetota bacterium]
MIHVAELIQRKRDGERLEPEEVAELVLEYARGAVPEEQMAAFCMAVYFRGLNTRETWALTDAMVRSGDTVDLSPVGRPVVDKHSTGGVGDKTTLVLGPLVAACGVPFAKMSGRGLGHTGGTLDKLESIPGYRVELEIDAFVRQVAEIGLAVIGQSERLVPADRRLYALRDHTATVDEISLIAASVMSKKLAAGADAILLDVKVGDGAFMKTREDGRRLASAMLAVAREADRRVSCELSGMDQPLGRAVGNALEVREALATLRGEGPPDLLELAVRAAATLVRLAGAAATEEEATRAAEAALASGAALEAYERWVVAQGGDPREESLPAAPVVRPVPAPGEGYVRSVDALGIARAAVRLGAG